MPQIILVMGNEAADLDSVACAVSFALTLYRKHAKESGSEGGDGGAPRMMVVPLIGVPRDDFALRTDAAWLFADVGVDVAALTFTDDLDPLALAAAGRLAELVLVDHNNPVASLRSLLPKVTRVIDHHQDESQYPPDAEVEIVLTGSCATLITEAIVATGDDLGVLAPGGPIAKMLAAAVLLDTQNLDANATRATPRDAAALKRLAPAAGLATDAEAEAFYHTLKRERFDQAGLSPRDLLRRDYKQWDMGVRTGAPRIALALALARTVYDCKTFNYPAIRYYYLEPCILDANPRTPDPKPQSHKAWERERGRGRYVAGVAGWRGVIPSTAGEDGAAG
jgi:inorganic pyrophosphatase/exopolyphosphatase